MANGDGVRLGAAAQGGRVGLGRAERRHEVAAIGKAPRRREAAAWSRGAAAGQAGRRGAGSKKSKFEEFGTGALQAQVLMQAEMLQ
uniref:Uncharacterized protein n=1 Tax=Oryza glumipatula TaxID=40148 RepID=A0A0E0B8C0_9ORYZ